MDMVNNLVIIKYFQEHLQWRKNGNLKKKKKWKWKYDKESESGNQTKKILDNQVIFKYSQEHPQWRKSLCQISQCSKLPNLRNGHTRQFNTLWKKMEENSIYAKFIICPMYALILKKIDYTSNTSLDQHRSPKLRYDINLLLVVSLNNANN